MLYRHTCMNVTMLWKERGSKPHTTPHVSCKWTDKRRNIISTISRMCENQFGVNVDTHRVWHGELHGAIPVAVVDQINLPLYCSLLAVVSRVTLSNIRDVWLRTAQIKDKPQTVSAYQVPKVQGHLRASKARC
jgi:hypothetical protein